MHIRGGKSDVFGLKYWQKLYFLGPNKIEIKFMIFLTSNIVELIFLCSLETILTSISIVSGNFMFIYGRKMS